MWRVSSAAIRAQLRERLARARSEIAEIADRRRHHVEPTTGWFVTIIPLVSV